MKKLQKLLKNVVNNDKEDNAAWDAAVEFVNSRVLIGMTREEIERELGPAGECGRVSYQTDGKERYLMDDKGFARNDLYYEVGKLPKGWVGGLPTIVIGFKAGKCDRVELIHTQ